MVAMQVPTYPSILIVIATGKATAIDPHHDREVGFRVGCGRVNVQREAVFRAGKGGGGSERDVVVNRL